MRKNQNKIRRNSQEKDLMKNQKKHLSAKDKNTGVYKMLVLFVFLFLLVRLPRIGNDIFNTDAVYWHSRSQRFINALESKNYIDTYQKYHPGVTLMWITGSTAKVFSFLYNTPLDAVFGDIINFHRNVKVVLIFWQLILSILAIFLLSKIYDFKKAVFMMLVLVLEPFYIGNSRLLHLDVLLSLYLLLSILFSYLGVLNRRTIYFILSGVFLGFSALTKSIGLGGFVFVVGGGFFLSVVKKRFDSKTIIHFLLLILVFVGTYYILFPALWVDAPGIISKMFEDSFKVGETKGHKQIFFGKLSHDPGVWFYPILFVLKLSLISITGFLIYYGKKIYDLLGEIVKFIKSKTKKVENAVEGKWGGWGAEKVQDNLVNFFGKISFIEFISIFYFGYFVVLVYFDKKVDRYPTPIYPFIAIVAVSGFYYLKKRTRNILVVFLSLTLIFSLVRFFPHYMVYTNPLIGNAKAGNAIVGQKLFGIGIYDLKDFIIKNYGEGKDVAINDPGPLRTIYAWDVYNIFVEHPNSYDLMILGPNKTPPPSVLNSGVEFEHDSSLYIGGLEFWRIFTKK